MGDARAIVIYETATRCYGREETRKSLKSSARAMFSRSFRGNKRVSSVVH
jgi:hypothetical protein